MKTSINQWAFGNDCSTLEMMDHASAVGFEAIELCVGEDSPIPLDVSDQDLDAIRSHAQKLGLGITSVACAMGFTHPVTSPDPAVRDAGINSIVQSLRIAQGVGAEAVLVVPGIVSQDISYDAAMERAIDVLNELIPQAESRQVCMAVENVWNKFLLSPLEMRDFIDQFESPWVGAYFDTGNIMAYGYPEQWIRILGSRIRKIHVKDFRVAVNTLDGFVTLMEGDVNWPRVVGALHEIGYEGTLTAETGPYRHSVDVVLKHCLTSLKAIISLEHTP